MRRRRPTPARDRSLSAVRRVHGYAVRFGWPPRRIRAELRRRRCACPRVWRHAVATVFGATPRHLKDLRQLPLFR